MKVLNQLHNPTIVLQLSRIYPVQSLASTGFYGAYNSYPPSTIIRNPNQIFSNTFAQYNPSPSINYSYLPITNSIPANYYSCQSLPINYSVPSLSYPRRYNPISSIGYSSLPTRITYYSPTYQSLNPPIPPNFYASQSSNLSHNFVSSNLSNFNVSSYRSNQVVVDSNLPIEFTDNFFMPIKNAHGSSDNLNLEQIARLVPNDLTGGILEPEIDANNKLKICNSVSLSEVQSKIWIRNGNNFVELPNYLLEKKPQISEQNLHSSYQTTQINQKIIYNETKKDKIPFPTIMTNFEILTESIASTQRKIVLEMSLLTNAISTHSNYKDNSLPSISPSTTLSNSTLLSSPSSLSSPSPSSSPSPPSTIQSNKFTIIHQKKIEKYPFGSQFIAQLTGQPKSSVIVILC